ncbi:MAG: hypothetical protein PHP01_08700, partial [Phycisphaerae bacterium]|nr:hypothetical protein [Phycisphaerae bacterium]
IDIDGRFLGLIGASGIGAKMRAASASVGAGALGQARALVDTINVMNTWTSNLLDTAMTKGSWAVMDTAIMTQRAMSSVMSRGFGEIKLFAGCLQDAEITATNQGLQFVTAHPAGIIDSIGVVAGDPHVPQTAMGWTTKLLFDAAEAMGADVEEYRYDIYGMFD